MDMDTFYYWNNHNATLFKYIKNCWQKPEYSDAIILCDGKYIHVHKMILSAFSNYFKDVFEKSTSRDILIGLPEIKYNSFMHILEYIYLGHTKVKQCDVQDSLKAASLLKIVDFQFYIYKHFPPHSIIENNNVPQNKNSINTTSGNATNNNCSFNSFDGGQTCNVTDFSTPFSNIPSPIASSPVNKGNKDKSTAELPHSKKKMGFIFFGNTHGEQNLPDHNSMLKRVCIESRECKSSAKLVKDKQKVLKEEPVEVDNILGKQAISQNKSSNSKLEGSISYLEGGNELHMSWNKNDCHESSSDSPTSQNANIAESQKNETSKFPDSLAVSNQSTLKSSSKKILETKKNILLKSPERQLVNNSENINIKDKNLLLCDMSNCSVQLEDIRLSPIYRSPSCESVTKDQTSDSYSKNSNIKSVQVLIEKIDLSPIASKRRNSDISDGKNVSTQKKLPKNQRRVSESSSVSLQKVKNANKNSKYFKEVSVKIKKLKQSTIPVAKSHKVSNSNVKKRKEESLMEDSDFDLPLKKKKKRSRILSSISNTSIESNSDNMEKNVKKKKKTSRSDKADENVKIKRKEKKKSYSSQLEKKSTSNEVFEKKLAEPSKEETQEKKKKKKKYDNQLESLLDDTVCSKMSESFVGKSKMKEKKKDYKSSINLDKKVSHKISESEKESKAKKKKKDDQSNNSEEETVSLKSKKVSKAKKKKKKDDQSSIILDETVSQKVLNKKKTKEDNYIQEILDEWSLPDDELDNTKESVKAKMFEKNQDQTKTMNNDDQSKKIVNEATHQKFSETDKESKAKKKDNVLFNIVDESKISENIKDETNVKNKDDQSKKFVDDTSHKKIPESVDESISKKKKKDGTLIDILNKSGGFEILERDAGTTEAKNQNNENVIKTIDVSRQRLVESNENAKIKKKRDNNLKDDVVELDLSKVSESVAKVKKKKDNLKDTLDESSHSDNLDGEADETKTKNKNESSKNTIHQKIVESDNETKSKNKIITHVKDTELEPDCSKQSESDVDEKKRNEKDDQSVLNLDDTVLAKIPVTDAEVNKAKKKDCQASSIMKVAGCPKASETEGAHSKKQVSQPTEVIENTTETAKVKDSEMIKKISDSDVNVNKKGKDTTQTSDRLDGENLVPKKELEINVSKKPSQNDSDLSTLIKKEAVAIDSPNKDTGSNVGRKIEQLENMSDSESYTDEPMPDGDFNQSDDEVPDFQISAVKSLSNTASCLKVSQSDMFDALVHNKDPEKSNPNQQTKLLNDGDDHKKKETKKLSAKEKELDNSEVVKQKEKERDHAAEATHKETSSHKQKKQKENMGSASNFEICKPGPSKVSSKSVGKEIEEVRCIKKRKMAKNIESDSSSESSEPDNKKHKVNYSDTGLICVYCKKQFDCPEDQRSHTCIRRKKVMLKCPHCLFESFSKKRLRNHITSHPEDDLSFSCTKCSYKCNTRMKLNSHMVVHKRPVIRKSGFLDDRNICKICKKAFTLKIALKKHVLTHKDEPIPSTSDPQKNVASSAKTIINCPNVYCPFRTYDPERMREHKRQHKNFYETTFFR